MDSRTAKLIDDIRTKDAALKLDKEPWIDEWIDVYRLVMPQRSAFRDTDGRPIRVGGAVYDGTPIAARNIAAYGICGYMMSAGSDWFTLTLDPEELKALPGVAQWLEYVERVLYSDFRRSNFYEATPELMKEQVTIGNGGFLVRENVARGAAHFMPLHPKEFYLAEDQWGVVNTVFRHHWPEAREIAEWYGFENLSKALQRKVEDSPHERVEILHAVMPRSERDVERLDSQNKPWASVTLEVHEDNVLRESGYDRLPYIFPRLMKQAGEVYGIGFGTEAIHEIKITNAMGRDILDAAHLSVNPPLNVPREMRNRLQLRPWGHNVYDQTDRQVTALNLAQNFPIGIDREERMQAIIEQKFLVDFFMMLQRAPDGITATEVIERQSEKAAVLGPIVQRIASDFLDSVIDVTFEIAMRNGRIPPPPPSLQMATGGRLTVEYIGPLAQAQRRFHRTRGINQSLGSYVPLLEVAPEIKDLVDWDALGRRTLEENGMPSSVIRDNEELRRVRHARAQAEQEMRQQMAAGQAAEAYPKLSKAPEPGSPMEAATEGARQGLRGGAPV